MREWSPAGRIVLIVLLAALVAACVTPAAEPVIRVPDSTLSFLRAAALGDLEGFLDSFDPEKATESRAAYEAMYWVWLARSTYLEWEVVWTEPRVGGGQAVVVRVVRTFDDREERIPHLFLTNESGGVVYWALIEEPRVY